MSGVISGKPPLYLREVQVPRVYVTQETNYDFRKAEEFGELVFLSLDRRDDFHNIRESAHNDRLVAHLRQGLRDFDPTADWLVLVGSPYVQAAVCAILGKFASKLRLLRWDNRDLCYIPLVLDV